MKMISDCVSEHYILGDALTANESEHAIVFADTFIYEVLRVIDGCPIFLQDHFDRLHHSAQYLGFELPMDYSGFKSRLMMLIDADHINNADLKIVVEYDGKCPTRFVAFEMTHNYPTDEMYRDGIHMAAFHAQRPDPNIKKNIAVRHRADEFIKTNDVYEIVYVDDKHNMLEGSRSNVFFVKGDAVYTAPSAKVLLGITRKYVYKVIADLGLTLVEDDVAFADLPSFDGVFVTSTPFNVLPVANIDDVKFDAKNKNIRRIMSAFDNIIEISKTK